MQPNAQSAVAALAALALAGCMAGAPDHANAGATPGPVVPPRVGDAPIAMPEGWQTGTRLTALMEEGTHGRGHGARLNATDLARPASCLAIRGNTSHAADRCTVRDAHEWERERGPAWVADAWWVRSDEVGSPPDAWTYRVAALDHDRHVIGWWDGRSSPWTQHITE